MWWTIAAALAAPWSEIVERVASPVDVRWSSALRDAAYADACERGDARGCALAKGEAPAAVFAAACGAGDAWGCLGAAWLDEAKAPEAAFATYQKLCDGGLDRACADVARARRDGIGTWKSARSARQLAEPLCEAGVAHGCLVLGSFDARSRPRMAEASYVRAIALGAESGVGGLLRMANNTEVGRLRDEACDQGLGWACLAAALAVRELDLDRSEQLLERGCDLGDPQSCMTLLLLRKERDLVTREQALTDLDALCSDELQEACIQAAFLRHGGEVKAFFPGTIQPIRATALRGQLIPYYIDCYQALLDRDRLANGKTTMELWVDADGTIRGAAPTAAPDDDTFRSCVVEATLGREVWRPAEGAARATIEANVGHEADVVVSARKDKDGTAQILRLEELLRADHAERFDQCYWAFGGSPYDETFTWVYGTIVRDGYFRYEKLVEGTGIEEADACIRDVLSDFPLGATYAYDEPARIYVKFGILFPLPKAMGFGHGKAADPDTYMNDPWLNLPE